MRPATRIAALLLAAACGSSAAQDYPTRPIRIILGFSAGSTTDILARTIGQKMNEGWGQPVLVDNRPSAGGVVASTAVATAAPGRLHAARRFGRARRDGRDVPEAAVRSAERFRRREPHRQRPEHSRGVARPRRALAERSGGAGEVEARAAQFLFPGRGQRQPSRRRGATSTTTCCFAGLWGSGWMTPCGRRRRSRRIAIGCWTARSRPRFLTRL